VSRPFEIFEPLHSRISAGGAIGCRTGTNVPRSVVGAKIIPDFAKSPIKGPFLARLPTAQRQSVFFPQASPRREKKKLKLSPSSAAPPPVSDLRTSWLLENHPISSWSDHHRAPLLKLGLL